MREASSRWKKSCRKHRRSCKPGKRAVLSIRRTFEAAFRRRATRRRTNIISQSLHNQCWKSFIARYAQFLSLSEIHIATGRQNLQTPTPDNTNIYIIPGARLSTFDPGLGGVRHHPPWSSKSPAIKVARRQIGEFATMLPRVELWKAGLEERIRPLYEARSTSPTPSSHRKTCHSGNRI